jgi:D-alanyl-D-alanine carboxypeptidase/D-alanyl-D-alanine-endopeptidase (penicillin-binding protein 4)
MHRKRLSPRLSGRAGADGCRHGAPDGRFKGLNGRHTGLFAGVCAGLAALLLAASAFAPPGAAAQLGGAGVAELQADFSHELALAGPESSAYVYDLTAKATLFSERATVPRRPASVEKLYTASAALALMGPEAHLQTTLLGAGRLLEGGIWEGSLYLRGGGDPSFGSRGFNARFYGGAGTSVERLAGALAHTVPIRRVTGSIYGDESPFDSLRGEPASGYRPDPFLEGTLSALAFNRGASGSSHGAHAPAAYAAGRLRASLIADGVHVTGGARAATTPAGAVELARAESPPLSALLRLTLPPSDNFFAETILKELGAKFAHAGTTAAGARVVRGAIATLAGIHPHIVDGSGLSDSDRTTTYEVVKLLTALMPSPIGSVLRGDLAVAGRSGTLAKRMRSTAAAGRCEAKTGTLEGASNLAGYCTSANGHELAFAIFTDGVATSYARTLQDHMAITLARTSIEL